MISFYFLSSRFSNSLCIAQSASFFEVCTGFIFSCQYWNTMKSTGTNKSKATVPVNMPPTTPDASERQPLAQTVFGCKVSRLYEAHPCLPPLHGIFSLEDGRFCQQPDEHDKPRLHVDIVLQSEQLRKQEAAQQSARHGKYDRERDEETLIQCT